MNSVVTAIFDVFEAVSAWFVESVPSLLALFYNAETGLTVIGAITMLSAGISVILLILMLVQKFFKFGV